MAQKEDYVLFYILMLWAVILIIGITRYYCSSGSALELYAQGFRIGGIENGSTRTHQPEVPATSPTIHHVAPQAGQVQVQAPKYNVRSSPQAPINLSSTEQDVLMHISKFQEATSLLEDEDDLLGQSYLGRRCSQEFGMDMLGKWRNSRNDVCSGLGSQSHITCLHREPFDVPRILCTATNSMIRMHSPFYQLSGLNPENQSYSFTKGILKVNCDLGNLYNMSSAALWASYGPAMFMKNIATAKFHKDMNCSNYVNHTVLWMARYDVRNPYHIMEDVVTTYETLVVLNEDPANVELAIYDTFLGLKFPIFEVWSRMFDRGVRIVRQNPYPIGTCFRKSIFNLYAGRSHLSNHDGVTGFVHCPSPVLRSMVHWIKSMFSVSEPDHQVLTGKILWISRGHYGNRNITRIIPNEPQILEYLRGRLDSKWSLEVFRPETMSTIQEVISAMSTVRIFIGVHGAGLTNLMFMPNRPESHVIEIFHSDRGPANRHYVNLCKWLNITHHSAGYYKSKVSPGAIWRMVDGIVSK